MATASTNLSKVCLPYHQTFESREISNGFCFALCYEKESVPFIFCLLLGNFAVFIFVKNYFQFHDGVYLVLLMGLLEGYFVPLYSFHLTPTSFDQKVSFFNTFVKRFILDAIGYILKES